MDKIYLVISDSSIKKKDFENRLNSLSFPYSITYLSPTRAVISSSEKLFIGLQDLLTNYINYYGIKTSILVAHKACDLSSKCLRTALDILPNRVVFLSDVILKELSKGDTSSLPYLKSEFQEVTINELNAAGAFLRTGLNVSDTAECLYLHRNTFYYRLNKFIDKTSLDIRDYHNALILEIYFQYCY